VTESTSKDNATAAKKLFGAAAKLAQKQAALATLNNVTFPKLYYAIGRKIAGLDNLPPDLVPNREKIRQLEAAIAKKPEELSATPSEGFAAKAKHLAQQAAQKAAKATADAAATMRIQAEYVALGKAAVEKYGEKAIPKELAADLANAQASREVLAHEVDELRQSSRVGLFTPARVLAVAGALVAVGLGFVVLRSRSGDDARDHLADSRHTAPTSPARSERPSDDSNPNRSDARYQAAETAQAGAISPRRSPFPLSWEKLRQMTGPEGQDTRYIRDEDGRLLRIESKHGGGLLVAVTEEQNGFRVTIGSEWAIADFAGRPWFSNQERDLLIDAFSRYITDKENSGKRTDTEVIGRYRVYFERDPHIKGAFVKPSIVLSPN
jgi:hypothetical protein